MLLICLRQLAQCMSNCHVTGIRAHTAEVATGAAVPSKTNNRRHSHSLLDSQEMGPTRELPEVY